MKKASILMAALVLTLAGPLAQAQTYPYPADPNTPLLGDDFIFFVEGTNVRVGSMTGNVADDPYTADNKVARIGMGSWSQSGFFFETDANGDGLHDGINMEANVDRGDTLFMKLNVAANAPKLLAITIRDVAQNVSADAAADLQFSVNWMLPDSLYDGQWHSLALPLPFKTKAEQDSARAGKRLDGTPIPAAEMPGAVKLHWNYVNSWNGSTSIGPTHEQWKDLTWYRVARVGLSFEGDGGTTYMVDDLYIGGAGTDLSIATAPANAPVPDVQVTVHPNKDSVTVSWTHDANSDIYGYQLYVSGEPVTGVTDPNARWVAGYKITDELSYTHPIFSPHPNVANQAYHYGLAASNAWGYLPSNAPVKQGSVTTKGTPVPYLYALTEQQENAIIANLSAQTAAVDGFAADTHAPFTLVGDVDAWYNGAYTGPEDASAKVWIAYRKGADYTTFYIYAEVLDDDPYLTTVRGEQYAGAEGFGSWAHDMQNTPYYDNSISWNVYLRDQLQFHFGTYEVPFTQGARGVRKRGETPDYFLSYTPYVDDLAEENTGNITGLLSRLWLEQGGTATTPDSTYYYSSNHPFIFPSVYADLQDGSGARIGWKMLAAVDAADLLAAVDANGTPVDRMFVPPADDEIIFIPFGINLVDKDDDHIAGRGNWWEVSSSVIPFTTKPNGGMAEAENTMAGVGAVAVAGINVVPTSTEQDELPEGYALGQNYPNPFNPATTIAFRLPAATKVSLSVYNVLGQRVATLLNGEVFAAGQHYIPFQAGDLASGLYFYRLEAGSFRETKQMTLLK